MIFFLKLIFGLTFQSNEFSLGRFYISLVFRFFNFPFPVFLTLLLLSSSLYYFLLSFWFGLVLEA